MRSRSHDEAMAEHYQKYPEHAIDILDSIFEDENAGPGESLSVLRQLSIAFGGMKTVAEKARLNPTQIYRTLSAEGNPSLISFNAILNAMGMRLAVKRIDGNRGAVTKKAVRGRKKPARVQAGAPVKLKTAR